MKIRTSLILILCGILAAGILGASTFLAVDWIDDFCAEVSDRLRLQSGSKLVAFTRLARDSLIRGQTEFLQTAADLLLVSSAHSVQVVVSETVVLEAQRQDDTAASEPISLHSLTPGLLAELAPASSVVLDLVLPIESASDPSEVVGYVRIVFDRSGVLHEVRARTALIVGIAAAIGVAVIGAWFGLAFILRRRHRARPVPRSEHVLSAGPLLLDTATKRVTYDGRRVDLTPKQLQLLCLLAGRPNHVFSDEEIVRTVWPASAYASSSDVKQCVYTLRRRFRAIHPQPAELIANVQGYGYRLAIPELEKDLSDS